MLSHPIDIGSTLVEAVIALGERRPADAVRLLDAWIAAKAANGFSPTMDSRYASRLVMTLHRVATSAARDAQYHHKCPHCGE